jgi:hypothetical protein
MIDSVLKGTGNSRFLKSAVPAGTSWADALAMLQAGTFPIDFNGINTEGFQQVGTPLNKANLLKDATAAQIGLPPSTTPDGMFQALGNTGELHVWRKTVMVSQESPAKYELGELQTGSFPFIGANYVTWESGTPIVADDGTVSLKTSASSNVNFNSNLNDLKGTYCKPNTASGIFSANQVIFIPNDANFIPDGAAKNVNKYQLVIGTPKVPAGTTTTYPVSTNPNAYQEGDDAKEAGYTLGEVKTGSFAITSKSSPGGVGTYWNDSSALSVSDDGTCTLATTGGTYIDGTTTNAATTAKNELQGKFAYCNNTDTDFTSSVIVFFPSNTTFTRVGNIVYADRYQPVTGYAAIPAGTTIEYLGKLGDKVRVQVISYVGTGTYGENNKNSLTFNFSPKVLLIIMSGDYNNRIYTGTLYPFSECGGCFIIGNSGWTSILNCSESKHEIFWWSFKSSHEQLNLSGYKYTAIAIG